MEELLRELAEMNPIIRESEMSDWCFFCEVEERYIGFVEGKPTYKINHTEDCLWKRARAILKID